MSETRSLRYVGKTRINSPTGVVHAHCFLISNFTAAGRCPFGYDQKEIITEAEKNLEYLEADITQILITHPEVAKEYADLKQFYIKIDPSGFPSILLTIELSDPRDAGPADKELVKAYRQSSAKKVPVVYTHARRNTSVLQVITL